MKKMGTLKMRTLGSAYVFVALCTLVETTSIYTYVQLEIFERYKSNKRRADIVKITSDQLYQNTYGKFLQQWHNRP